MSFKNRNPKAAGPLAFAHFGLDKLARIETGSAGAARERFPIRWTHLIEKESLEFKALEHVLFEKADQLF